MTIPHSPVGQRRIKMVMVDVLLHTATIPSVSTFCQDGLRLWRVCVHDPTRIANCINPLLYLCASTTRSNHMRFIQTTILLTVILALGTLGLFAAPIPEQPLDQVPEASVVAAEPSEDSPVIPCVPAFYRNQGGPKMNAATASFAGGVQQRLRVLDPELNECDCVQDGYGQGAAFMGTRQSNVRGNNAGAAFGAGLRTLDRDRNRQTLRTEDCEYRQDGYGTGTRSLVRQRRLP